MSDLLVIGEVVKRSGVAASALRFYEERGLIQSEREGTSQRRYPRSVLRRIAFIVFAQRIGLSLDEIATELAKLPPDRAPTGKDWSRRVALGPADHHGGAYPVHRLRMFVARSLRAVQSWGSRGTVGAGCPILDRGQAGQGGPLIALRSKAWLD